MATWYWTGVSGDMTATTSWNSLPDGSGTTPTNVLNGSGSAGSSVIDDDTLVFWSGSQSVTSNHNGLSARNVTVRGTNEYRGSIGTSSVGCNIKIDNLYWACRSPLAHFSGNAEANATVEVQRTGTNNQSFIFSGNISASGAKLLVQGGNVYFSNGSSLIRESFINGGNVSDVLGVQWRSPVVSGGVFSSQNTPRDSTLSSGSYPTIKVYGGEVFVRNGLVSGTHHDFHAELYGGRVNDLSAANLVNFRAAGTALYSTEGNPYGRKIGQNQAGTTDGDFIEVFPTATLKLTHTALVLDFPNGLDVQAATSTGAQGGIEIGSQSNVSGLSL